MILKKDGNKIEEIEYIRMKDGGFHISRNIYADDNYKIYNSIKEIDALEFESISRGVLENVDSCDRLFSYFDSSKDVFFNMYGYYEQDYVCKNLGIPLISLEGLDIPRPLLDSIPYIDTVGRIMATEECLIYLEEVKKSIEDTTKERNRIWLKKGVETLIEIVNEKRVDIRRV